jgi:RNA polymerase sigma-70 factor (ECF subfamily)
LGRQTSASEVAMRLERKARLQEALEAMDPLDRDVLVLRHFEELTNAETALTLRMQESAASKRYIRALRKLKDILSSMAGGTGEFRA